MIIRHLSRRESLQELTLGAPHTSRKTGVESDLVIRNAIQVGSEVALKYLPEKPDTNVLILKDPTVPAT